MSQLAKFKVGDRVVPKGYDHSLAVRVKDVIPDEGEWYYILDAMIRVTANGKALYDIEWLPEKMLEAVNP